MGITYVTGFGETTLSPVSPLAVDSTNQLIVASPSTLQAVVTRYNVYIDDGSGNWLKQNTSPIAMGTNWTMPDGVGVGDHGWAPQVILGDGPH